MATYQKITYCQKILKLLDTYKAGGLISVFIKIKKYVAENVYLRKYLWYEMNTGLPIRREYSKLPLSIEMNSRDEVMKWISTEIYNGRCYKEEDIEAGVAIINNHYFPCVKMDRKIVGFMKVGCNDVYIKNFNKIFSVSKRSAFIYSVYVDPKYRNLNVASVLISDTVNNLKALGFSKISMYIRSTNVSSIRVFTKLGAKKIGKVLQLKCFGLNIFTNPQIS